MLRIELGDEQRWEGKANVVFTHPYAPIPKCLHGKPMIINLYTAVSEDRKLNAERWCATTLHPLGVWGRGATNTLFVGNLPPRPLKLEDLKEDMFKEGIGWFPVELPRRLLSVYSDLIKPPMVVWDGFCGRGTVGAACAEFGLDYIGIDIRPDRVELAREFLGLK
jgi:hypothetical protein